MESNVYFDTGLIICSTEDGLPTSEFLQARGICPCAECAGGGDAGLEDIPPAAIVDDNLVGLVVIGDQVGNLSVCKDPLHC